MSSNYDGVVEASYALWISDTDEVLNGYGLSIFYSFTLYKWWK